MKKKVLAVVLAAAMAFSLAACGGEGKEGNTGANGDNKQEETQDPSGSDAEGETEDSEENAGSEEGEENAGGSENGGTDQTEISLDGSWPEETVKIGFIGYDSTSEQQLAIQNYFDSLEESYNIEIMYSEDLADAEAELNFIADCAAAGCKGIIGYYNEAKEEAAKTASAQGMYYWGSFGGDADSFNAVKDDEYYLGGYTLGEAEYEAGRSMALALAEQGCEKVVLCSGGASMGVPMFVDRKDGFLAGVEEAVAGGATMEVVEEVEGWPGTDAFTAAQTSVMDMEIDAIASTFDVAMWFQLVMESGKADSISLACIGEVSDTYYDFFNSGLVTCIVYDNEEVVFGNAIPMILNAVSGNKLVNEDGSAILFPVERWTITDPEDFNAVYDLHDAGEFVISAEDMAQLITALNPEANTESFTSYYGSFNIDSVK